MERVTRLLVDLATRLPAGVVIEARDGLVAAVRIMVNPDKLHAV
ncbi:MAG: hypothetical protein QM733_08555 [Ilumatobacteraceae bacterium]